MKYTDDLCVYLLPHGALVLASRHAFEDRFKVTRVNFCELNNEQRYEYLKLTNRIL